MMKAIITGMLHLSPDSLFSKLDNYQSFTVVDKEFSDKFGLTNKEVEELLNEYYRVRGWTPEGIPSKEKLAELELVDEGSFLQQ